MTTAEIESLLERVRKAEGPNAELDSDLGFALGWYAKGYDFYAWAEADGSFVESVNPKPLTASVDACLALIERVQPGLVIDAVKVGDGSGRWQVREAWISDMDGAVVDPFSPPDPRPGPLAFLEALLLALLHQASDKGMIDAD